MMNQLLLLLRLLLPPLPLQEQELQVAPLEGGTPIRCLSHPRAAHCTAPLQASTRRPAVWNGRPGLYLPVVIIHGGIWAQECNQGLRSVTRGMYGTVPPCMCASICSAAKVSVHALPHICIALSTVHAEPCGWASRCGTCTNGG
jgi:hypothetical protein